MQPEGAPCHENVRLVEVLSIARSDRDKVAKRFEALNGQSGSWEALRRLRHFERTVQTVEQALQSHRMTHGCTSATR
jgi:hypothetical protein